MTLLRIVLTLVFVSILPAAAEPIRIAVPHDPPYAVHDPSGISTGLAVDLLRLAAEAGGFDVDLVQVDGDPLGALATFRAVAPVSASEMLEREADLSLPLHTATLGVARTQGGLWDVVRGVLTLDFLRVVGSVAALLLVVGAIVWRLERRRNSDQFHEGAVRGLGDGFWWAGVTLTTIGYGDKAPVTRAGRAVAMVWMLAGLAVSASLTATIISATGAGSAAPDLPEAFAGERIAVAADGPAERFVSGRNLDVMPMENASQALRAVVDGTADVALGAGPALTWASEREGMPVEITTTQWEPILKVVAMRPGDDDLRETLNRALLIVLASEAGQETVRRYLSD